MREDCFAEGEFEEFLKSFWNEKEKLFLKKPYIVEFAGPPKSGKTSLIDSIKYRFNDYGIIPEVSIDSAVKKEDYLQYIINSQAKTRERLIEAKYRRKEEIIFLDCGAFSELALFDAFHLEERLQPEQEWMYKNLRKQILFDFVYEDLVIYVSIPLDYENKRINEEIERISDQKVNKRSIINPEFIEKFNLSYEKLYNEEPIIGILKDKIKFIKIDGRKKVNENIETIMGELGKIRL
jgi:thymidylate kinase